MRRIAVIATDMKPAEDLLVETLTKSGHETVTIKPDRESVRKLFEKIRQRKGVWGIIVFVEKDVADYAVSMAKIIGLEVEVKKIINEAENAARIELARIFGDDYEHDLD
ncbi:MAG: hypothetical protein WC831_01350 [Parcubacteria group bacterium]|jgi:hypothetical protein